MTSCCRGGAPDRKGPPSLSCTLVITIVANPIVNKVYERHQVQRLDEVHEVSGFQLVGGDCLNLKETCNTGCTATGLTSYTYYEFAVKVGNQCTSPWVFVVQAQVAVPGEG